MKIFKKGFNYSQDGPGNRLVYHLQGCNFNCKWCSNPESMDICGDAEEHSVKELLKEAKSCMPMFFNGGGVTLTGGEPTLQFDEVLAFLKGLKELKIHTAIESNGSHPNLEELIKYIDYLIMDVKHFDEKSHILWTGVSNKNTIINLEKICISGRQALIRIPVVKGVNDRPREFAEFFSGFDCKNILFEFLAYHEFGKNKWTKPYEIEDGFITGDVIKSFEEEFKRQGLNITRT